MNIVVCQRHKNDELKISAFDRLKAFEVDGFLEIYHHQYPVEYIDSLMHRIKEILYKEFITIGYTELSDNRSNALCFREMQFPEVGMERRVAKVFDEITEQFGLHFNGKVFGVGTPLRCSIRTMNGKTHISHLPH